MWGFSHRLQITKIKTNVDKKVEFTYFHLFRRFFEWVFGRWSSGFVFEGLTGSFRKTLTRLVMTTSVRFTGVLAHGKMNIFFILHQTFFLLNLIDHASI